MAWVWVRSLTAGATLMILRPMELKMTLIKTMSTAAVIASAFATSSAFAGPLVIKNNSNSCVRLQNSTTNLTADPGESVSVATSNTNYTLTKYVGTICMRLVESRETVNSGPKNQIIIISKS